MNELMTQRFRMYRRQRGMFYLFDCLTGQRQSLETEDRATAQRLTSPDPVPWQRQLWKRVGPKIQRGDPS